MNFKKKLQFIKFFFISDGFKRGEYLKKKDILRHTGENVFFQPRKLPADPKLIKINNNVAIASGVTFICHDVIHHVFNNIENKFDFNMGCIEIGENVFIGANSIIMPNVKIGNNVIIGAGSLINKNIESNCIVAGVPARKIGDFDKFYNRRLIESESRRGKSRNEIIELIWKEFDRRNGEYNNA